MSDGVLTHRFYNDHIERAPLFLKGETEKRRLQDFIKKYVKHGDHAALIYRIEGSRIRPSKGLVDSLVGMLTGKDEFVLVDDQKVVFENAIAIARKSSGKLKQVLIVEGGPFERIPQRAVKQYVNSVPLIDLKFAAGVFSGTQAIADSETTWVKLPDIFRPQRGLFVAQVIGESMNRRIPNGAWCLFRMNPVGTRQGKVVVAQHRNIHDPDLGGSYTVKVYESEKQIAVDGEWRHSRIMLKPDSTDASYSDLEFDLVTSEGLSVVAELISVL